MHPNAAGALVNSALYLLCTFAAGLATGHPLAWKLALAAMGAAFFSHVAAMLADRRVSIPLVFGSWLLGAGAGLTLLF